MKIIVRNIIILILLLLPATLCAQVDPIYQWSNGDTTAIINVSPAQTTVYYVTVTYGSRVIYDSITVEVDSNTYSTDTVTACGSYTWRDSITYTSNNNTATDTILNSAGCDSIITLDLTILSPTYATINESACDTFVSPSGNYTWTSSGTYNDTLVNSEGCDSVITINLDIIGGNLNTESITACDSYTWPVNGQTYLNSGSYNDTLTSSQGCDSVLVLDLTINNSTSSSQTVSECNAYTWQVNGQTYTASGIYRDTLLNSVNCDSVLTLDLTILNSSTSTINEMACDSFISPSGNYTWTSSGSYNDTLVNSQGCDSLITVNLTVNYSSSNSENITACDEYTWPVNGQTYTTGGSYSDTLQSTAGCDSILVLNLTINNSTSSTNTVNTCDDYTWAVNGNTYTQSGIYYDTIPNAIACDSFLTLDLTIDNSIVNTTDTTVCDEYTWPVDGQSYDSSGTYRDTLLSSTGCDSILVLNLTIIPNTIYNSSQTVCDAFTWSLNGQTYTNSGTYYDTTAMAVCDSIVELDLTILNSTSSNINETACDSFVSPSGNYTWTSSGTYNDTLLNAVGCDSLISVNLTINNSSNSTDNISTCNSYTWPVNGQTYTTSGTYADTLQSVAGCDSILTLILNIGSSYSGFDTVVSCNSYTWPVNGITYTNGGTYYDTIGSGIGCDSTFQLDLTLNFNSSSSENITACDEYTWPVNGQNYTTSGVYSDTLTNTAACDSVLTLDLTINSSNSISETVTACDSYTWPVDGNTYNTSGVYSDTLANSLGCDSIVTLDLTLNLSSTSTINESACDSYTSPSGNYTWTNSGNYTDTLANAAGCDSIITIDLTIHNSTATTENISACDDYTWPVNGQSYTTSGIYSDTLISATGCDSVLTLDLTINSSNSISETVTACDSYTWPVDGNTYNASGIYSDTLSNSIGCDSILILDLNINSSNSGSENITACNTYTWTLSGDTYTQSGVYTDTSTNAAGCDSIATLNLTINNNSTGSASFTACDSFTAPSGNFVWTNSGTYTDTINASTGCDSIITINLTINFSNSFSENITECYSYTWPVNGQEYTTSGTYTTTLSNAAGCDSLLILNLNIQEDILTSTDETICEGDSIFLNGNWQSAPGNYTDTFSTTSSCDSIVSTTLSLQPNYTDSTEVTLEPGELFNGDIFVSDTTLLFQYYSADGCDSIVLTKIEVLKESVVFVPNAFTPNGDGINDLFKVYGTRIESMRLQIFNRWGEMIFETNEIDKGWDGTYKGEKLPAGLYVYILRGVAANEFVKEVGKVSLLR